MASKNIVCFQLSGGMDGVNLISPRDASSVARIQATRQGAPANVLNYTDTVAKTGTLTINSNVVSSIVVSGLTVGMVVYGVDLPATRGLTIATIGSGQITLSDVSYVNATGTTLNFGTADQLLKLNESVSTGRNPAFHYSQSFLWDTFNIPDTVGNASKVKSAVICNIGVLRKKLAISGNNLVVVGTGSIALNGIDVPNYLTSHNDQISIIQSNLPEGASKGWGGGIADGFISNLSGINTPLASISASGLPVFSSGTDARTFTISQRGLMSKLPNFYGTFTSDTTNSSVLNPLYFQAMQVLPANRDIETSAAATSKLAIDYQDILGNAMQITDPPNIVYNISGSALVNGNLFAKTVKAVVRMLLANNPNRGGTATRTGTTVTINTEITNGLANRTSGSNIVTVTDTNHRLFTSNLSSDITDSVIVLGTGLDTTPTSDGYKITLLPSDVDNKFTFSTTSTTALVNVPVTVRLKHNLTLVNRVFIDATGFDTPNSTTGYLVNSIINNTSFTITTTQSGALTPSTFPLKFKLINLPNQVLYSESPGFSWDTHPEANHSHLAVLNQVCVYFNSLVSRIADANVTTFISTDFGRTLSTNSVGTDHGWGNNYFVFGKDVKGNKVYGDVMDYASGGAHLYNNYFMPTTSINQYGATFAKWMGLTDAQILLLFPDLINWPANERYLGFL